MQSAETVKSNPRLGIMMMLAGIMLFSLNDVLGKWLVATYSVGQVLLIRSLAALLLLSPFVIRAGGLRAMVSLDRPMIQILRVVVSSAEVYFFYFAVVYLPLADAMTYWMAAPIYVAALSPAAIISILGSLAFAVMLITSRLLRGTPDTALVFWQMVGAALLGLVTAPFTWVPVDAVDMSLLALLGAVAMVAHVCVNRALKLGDAATIVPFQYTLLFWAIVFGWLVFGDVPKTHMLVGAVVIVGAGLFIFFREQQLKFKPADEALAPPTG